MITAHVLVNPHATYLNSQCKFYMFAYRQDMRRSLSVCAIPAKIEYRRGLKSITIRPSILLGHVFFQCKTCTIDRSTKITLRLDTAHRVFADPVEIEPCRRVLKAPTSPYISHCCWNHSATCCTGLDSVDLDPFIFSVMLSRPLFGVYRLLSHFFRVAENSSITALSHTPHRDESFIHT